MSTTVVAPGGLEVSSNHESADAMLASLTPQKADAKSPRVLVKDGKPIEDGKDDSEESRAASVLGKKGGKAAAEARKEAVKAKPADEKPDAKEAKPGDEAAKDEKAAKGKAEGDDEDEGAEKDTKAGNPRHDPKARISVLAREKREAQERADRLERELAEARRAPARPEAPAREAKPAARAEADRAHEDPSDPRPKLDDYEGDGAYERFVEDTSRWAARDENRKVERRTRETEGHRKVAEEIQGHVDGFHERVTGLKKGDSGQGQAFSDYMASLPDELGERLCTSIQLAEYAHRTNQPHLRPGPDNLITDLIVKSEKSRELLDHFAADPSEFQRIAALRDPYAIAGEMAILSHSLDAATADTSSRREVSRAGTPPRSVSGSPRTADPDLSNVPFEEHMRQKSRAKA